jgi:hypothetical protein
MFYDPPYIATTSSYFVHFLAVAAPCSIATSKKGGMHDFGETFLLTRLKNEERIGLIGIQCHLPGEKREQRASITQTSFQ